jgi:serine/threonine protein kinase
MIAPTSRKIGRYEIRRKLGRGGMADVYLAFDMEHAYEVALKLIEEAEDGDTRDFIEAERRGAELQARLAEADPHVARVYDCGEVDGYFFVAMEYVEGRDLAEVLREGRMAPERAADIAIAVAATLDAAHHLQVEIGGKSYRGIVHGDIKPKNIRIDTKDRVRVLDFGIAKALSMTRNLTRNEFGSVPYSSPERLQDGQVDVQSDLWSLAVMLYEMTAGMQPYQADTTERLERMIQSRVPPPPAPDPCPEPLRRILVKAMMPEPSMRYQSARDLANDLILFRTGGPVSAMEEDLDATRRTYRTDETRRTAGEDETRRTNAGMASPEACSTYRKPDEVIQWPGGRRAKSPWAAQIARGVAAVLLGGVLWAVWSGISGYMVYRRGQELAQKIQTEQLKDPNEIWTRWTELSGDNPSSLLLRAPRKIVREKLVEAGDRVITSYRNSDAVYENGWKGARDNLARALSLGADDTVRGKLRLTEGHIARINGTTHQKASELNDAVEKFTEAQRLLPNSPDPALGLARVYVYGLHDIDKAYDALQQAAQHGRPLGNREQAQLADGYRDRGNREFWDSRKVRDLAPEKDQIQHAKQDLQRALQLYQSIAPYGNSPSMITDVQTSLESVNNRLGEIERRSAVDAAAGALRKLLHIWR